uniref:Ribosomal RNA processing 1B n=1 Tax=Mus musculus TaxID=10090 RepID=D6RDD0_MOUSE
MALAMQSSEFQFAQRLASSEKGVRDRAVRKLRQYLSARTQSDTGSFSQEELLKIWKGLFYCMWVQDEPLLQVTQSPRHGSGPLPRWTPICCHPQTDGSKCFKEPLSQLLSPQEGAAGT